jgi:hypothetical protein
VARQASPCRGRVGVQLPFRRDCPRLMKPASQRRSLDEPGRAKRATSQLLSRAVSNDPPGDFRTGRGLFERRLLAGTTRAVAPRGSSRDALPRHEQVPPATLSMSRVRPTGSSVIRHRGCSDRRVILTEHSEIGSESRRQPTVLIARSATDARAEPSVRCCRCRDRRSGSARAWSAQTNGVSPDADRPPSRLRSGRARRTRSATPPERGRPPLRADPPKHPSSTTGDQSASRSHQRS